MTAQPIETSSTSRFARLWPVLLGAGLFALTAFTGHGPSGPDFALALPAMAAIYLVWSLFSRELVGRQVVGLVLFTVIGVAGLMLVDHDAAYVVVAAGLFGHAAWDFHHYRLNKTVSRWYALACGVFDALLGISVLVSLFT